jgi:hypothetical protein
MAIDSSRLAGTAYLTVDGVNYMLVGQLKYSPSKVSRESLVGQDGPHGFKEMPRVGSISMTLRDSGTLKVGDFNTNMVDVTVVARLANGKAVSGAHMWCVDAQEVDTNDGTFEVKFEGREVVEL